VTTRPGIQVEHPRPKAALGVQPLDIVQFGRRRCAGPPLALPATHHSAPERRMPGDYRLARYLDGARLGVRRISGSGPRLDFRELLGQVAAHPFAMFVFEVLQPRDRDLKQPGDSAGAVSSAGVVLICGHLWSSSRLRIGATMRPRGAEPDAVAHARPGTPQTVPCSKSSRDRLALRQSS